jgi:hypothetical protein
MGDYIDGCSPVVGRRFTWHGEVRRRKRRREKRRKRRRRMRTRRRGLCLCRQLKLQQDGNLHPEATAACLK